jgi:hypothetical protein
MRFSRLVISTVVVFVLTLAATVLIGSSAKATIADGKAYYSVANDVTFPVGKAARNWNLNTKGIELIRVTACEPSLRPCVDIQQKNVRYFINAGGLYWADTAITYWSDQYQIMLGYPMGHIELAFHGRNTYKERQQIICHEFGHFLNVPHSKNGCMRPFIRPNNTYIIDPHPYAGDYNRSLIYLPHWSTEWLL